MKRYRLGLDNSSGFITVTVLSIIIAMAIVTGAVIEIIDLNTQSVRNNIKSQQALNIAEAGINYYLWHLSHNATDYKDGQTTPTTPDANLGYGPYVHNYIDDNANTPGKFTIWVKPQGGGSTIVTIRSIGQVNGSDILRTVDAQIGAPSFASYGVVSDSALWFGATETANGPVHSNQGVRMDGASTDNVSSQRSSYTPSGSVGGEGNSHPGVWCNSSVITPVNCNTRNKSDWLYPVPTVDFTQVTNSLCTIKKVAFGSDSATSALANQANACTQTPTTRTAAYLPQRSTTGSYSQTKGYLMNLNNNGTYDLYQVNAETDTQTPYTSALTTQLVANAIAIPTNGVVFAEDNVWVRSNSTFHGRLTIAAGRLATNNNAQIVIADDIIYSTKNGTDALGLVAEGDISIAPYAPPNSGAFNFEVDAAVLSQSGSVWYPSTYRSSTSSCTKGWVSSNQTFTYYGSVATRQTWTWTWLVGNNPCGNAAFHAGDGYISGILNNSTQYDYNLLYSPPPSFPITSTYNILSWREVLTKP